MFGKNIFKETVLTKLDELLKVVKTLQDKRETKKEKHILVHYHWSNETSASKGHSSAIVTLKKDELLNAEKIVSLQKDLLKLLEDSNHPYDPTNVVILSVTRLD